MTRFPDWPERLNAWVDANRARTFAWGEWDCVLAAADCAHALTGADPLEGLRWNGLRGALRCLEVEGGLEAAVTRVLGAPIGPALAQRGDVLLIDTGALPMMSADLDSEDAARAELRHALAVCLGEACAAPTRAGLALLPVHRVAHKAWRVGHG